MARDTTGNTGGVISALRRWGGVECKLVNENCNVKDYDGLVLPGGVDINPALYHQKNTASVGINNQLDKMQYKILDKFVKAGKPVLGVCRGMQLINVYFGGTLRQNVKGHRGLSHPTTLQPDSWLYKAYGKNYKVNSWHHQAVDKVGKNLKVTQNADKDKGIEGIQHETLPIYGVQYHPEYMNDGKALFQEFVKICRQNAKK